MMRKLGLNQLITLGFCLLLAVAAAIGIVAVRTDWKTQHMNVMAVADSRRALLAEHLIMLQQRQQAVARAFFLQPSKDARARFDEATRDLDATFAELQSLTPDPEGAALLKKAGAACNDGMNELEAMFTEEGAGHHNAVLDRLANNVALNKKIRDSLGNFRNYSGDRAEMLEKNVEQQKQSATHAIWFSCIVLGLGIILAIACELAIIRIMGRRIQHAHRAIDAIAHCDLSGEDITVDANDHLGQALTALNSMKADLAEVVGGLRLIAEQVAAASTEMAATAQESAAGAHRQREQTDGFASELRQMAETVAQIAEHAASVSKTAVEAADTARQGDDAVAAIVDKMRQIAAGSSGVAESIKQLARSSDEIGRASGLIREVAEQTNLLALNAAIEAARAGEQGRGFAVVAGEVRRLAERTSKATEQIDGMVSTVAAQMAVTLQKTEAEQDSIEQGVALANATRQSLTQIRESVGNVEAMTSQIAAATTQETASTQELQANLKHIADMISASDVAAGQSSAACSQLSQLSEQIKAQFERFVLAAQ